MARAAHLPAPTALSQHRHICLTLSSHNVTQDRNSVLIPLNLHLKRMTNKHVTFVVLELQLCHSYGQLSVTFGGLTFKSAEASPRQMTAGGHPMFCQLIRKPPFNTSSLPYPKQMAHSLSAAHISDSMSSTDLN